MSFDFLDRFRLYQAVESVEQMKRAAATPNPFAVKQADVEALQQEIRELRLHIAVLYRVLLTNGIFTEAEIHDLISSLDLADGKPDGQFDGDPVTGISVAMHPAEEPDYPEIRTT